MGERSHHRWAGDDPITDRRDCRSPEALARRRERKDYDWVTPVRPPIVSITPLPAPSPPPIPDDLLLDAERRLEFGARVIVSAFVDDVRGALRVSVQDATAVVNELISQGRLTRNVASNGFVTLTRPSGCRRAK